jgi:hypothetical protein
MMYVRDEDLVKLKANVAAFIDGASKHATGAAAGGAR